MGQAQLDTKTGYLPVLLCHSGINCSFLKEALKSQCTNVSTWIWPNSFILYNRIAESLKRTKQIHIRHVVK